MQRVSSDHTLATATLGPSLSSPSKMAQNGGDLPATSESQPPPAAVVEDNVSKIQAEIPAIPDSEMLAANESANETVENAADETQTTMRPRDADIDISAQETSNSTEETPIIPSDGHAGPDQTTSLSDVNAPELLAPATSALDMTMPTTETISPSTAPDEKNQIAAISTDFGQDLLSLAGVMSGPDSAAAAAAAVPQTASNDAQNTVHDESTGNEGSVDMSEQVTNQLQDTNDGTTESAPAAHTSQANIAQPDSDIEEGEELGSPPPPQIQQDLQQQQKARSSSVATISRRREGRSRSPNRERRPSPQRGTVKPPVNRDELFKVYIGGLPEKTELADLEDCFSQFGEIGHVELKLGYAFIVSPDA